MSSEPLSVRDKLIGIAFMMLCGLAIGGGAFLAIHYVGFPNFQQPTMTYVNGYTTYVQQSSCQSGMIIENCFYYHLNYTLNGKVVNYNDGLKYDWVGNLDAGDVICVQLANGNYYDFTVGDCK